MSEAELVVVLEHVAPRERVVEDHLRAFLRPSQVVYTTMST